MRRYVPYLAAAFCAGLLTCLSPGKADASQYAALAQSASQPAAGLLQQIGYYGGGGGGYSGDDQNSYDDDGYGKKPEYYGGGYKRGGYGNGYRRGGYNGGGYGSGYNGGGYSGHRDNYKRYDEDSHEGCYKRKWVCEESEPRCFRQRDCVWNYGREYCRYVKRCNGGGDRYCKWITVPSYHCGY
jgi:hypothetical protein